MAESKDCATFIVMGASVSGRLISNRNGIYSFISYRGILLRKRSILRFGKPCIVSIAHAS